jgi:hypothetical protein
MRTKSTVQETPASDLNTGFQGGDLVIHDPHQTKVISTIESLGVLFQ